MTNTMKLALASAAVVLSLGAAGQASAQSRTQGQYFDPARQAPPLTVRGRTFTDSGTAAPVGYANDYLVEQTALNQPTYQSFMPDSFGRDVLPGRFGGIGDSN